MVISGAGAVQTTGAAGASGAVGGMNAVFNSVLPADAGGTTAATGTNAPTNATFNASYSGAMSNFYGEVLQQKLAQQELIMVLQERNRIGVGIQSHEADYDPPKSDGADVTQDANAVDYSDGDGS